MRLLLAAAAADAAMLLRRRCCSAPLLLLGVALCLYQTLMVHRNRSRSAPLQNQRQQQQQQQQQQQHHEDQEANARHNPSQQLMEETRRLIKKLETLHSQTQTQRPRRRRRAVVVTGGQFAAADTELQMYQRVLQQMDYEVQLSRSAETISFLAPNHGESGWSLLLCLPASESSCLRRVSAFKLKRHQRVNLLPGLMVALSGLCQPPGPAFPMQPQLCGSTNHKPLRDSAMSPPPAGVPPAALVAMVNVYVVVTSVKPLTSFLHDRVVLTADGGAGGRSAQLHGFLLQQLGPAASQRALGQLKTAVARVLRAAANRTAASADGCVLCFQLLTFTLKFTGSLTPAVVQVEGGLNLSALSEETFDRQISRELILEDTLHFLLSWEQRLDSERMGGGGDGCGRTDGVCFSQDHFLLLLQFQRLMTTPSPFHLLNPAVGSWPSWPEEPLSEPLGAMAHHYEPRRKAPRAANLAQAAGESDGADGAAVPPGLCADGRLRQIYGRPALRLRPAFSPEVREYRAEVTFDTLTVRVRPEPLGPACRVHLDERRGPRMAVLPVALGDSRLRILVTDAAEPEPVTVAVYTVHLFRESRPGLPAFGDRVMCGFLQDCGLRVLPGQPCGLQPLLTSQTPAEPCTSGDGPGQWVVPCLSCSDNRTCDWREVAWQPDGCYHQLVEPPLLQDCLTDRKVLFMGDSTNRGMMYFLMERVNSSLEDWGKAHDMLVYQNLNRGRTWVSYSYYPQFWLEKQRRPTFREALEQLLIRSRPLADTDRTVLVVGGVQWLTTGHLRTVREVLNRAALSRITVLVKSLGMGFHLPVHGIRSLALREIQELHSANNNIISTAKHLGYQVIDTFGITMGRYKEFLQGRCACHFHEVEKWTSSGALDESALGSSRRSSGIPAASYHVRGAVNQVYSQILLSRLCAP